MNEKICEQILEYMKGTGDFILQEMPDVVQQTLKYHYFSSIFTLCVAIPIFIAAVFFLFFFLFNIKLDKYDNWTSMTFGCIWTSVLISILSFMFTVSAIDNLIKISYAPKYFIISLLKNGK